MTAFSHSLPEFRNEPVADFSVPHNRRAMEAALEKVRSEFGHEYDLLVGGERVKTAGKLRSVNPSRPAEIVGIHQKATPELATRAVEAANAYFPEWSATSADGRIRKLLATARLLREHKFEFDSWLVYEAGKTWPEADADTSEAIDFCEYYAREMLRLSGPHPVVQMPGEKDEMRYLALGVGIVIPPWNFPLAILAGMTAAALVTGNTVVIKPSSETPTVAAKFAELLLEAGFPARSFCFLPGSGSAIGDLLVEHPKTRFIAFTGSRDVGLRINELAARTQPGQRWIKRVIAEMGGKDAIIVDADADLDKAVDGVAASAFGYQGQKCSACSRAIVDARVYDEFLVRLKKKTETLTVGAADDPASFMGPVISDGARRTILEYIERRVERGEAGHRRPSRARRRLFHPADCHRRCALERACFSGRDFRTRACRDQGERLHACARAGQRLAVRLDGRCVLQQPRAHSDSP